MRYLLALLVVGTLLVGACSTLPLPGVPGVGVGSGMPQTCSERLSESSCQQGTRCHWINDARRTDGTIATAHCDGD